jgi:hypothetical protein
MSDFEFDTREFVRRFRSNYVNVYARRDSDPALANVTVHTPSEQPLQEADLPEGVRGLLAEYAKAHPQERVELVKYLRLENGHPVEVVEDESELPPDDELLSLSRTVTIAASEFARVVTEVYVARRSPRGRSGSG